MYSKDNGGPGHENFYEYDTNGDMIYFHSTIGGSPYLYYHAEYENHKMVHRYSDQSATGEHHEWWRYSDNYTKCTYENSLTSDSKFYEYDLKGNKIYEKSSAGEFIYEYDDSNNLISKKSIFSDGKPSLTVYEYDSKGNKISEKGGVYDTSYDYEFYEDGKIKSITKYNILPK